MERINRQNEDGALYREAVRHHLETVTGDKNDLKGWHGPDLRIGDMLIEVKGTKSLYYVRNNYHQIRGWKACRSNVETEGLTHCAFVLREKHLCSQPLIYVVPIGAVKDRASERSTDWIYFPVWWVFQSYDKKLSRVP